jgi:hypothetical protein
VRVEVQQSGGLAGLTREGSFETTGLPSAEAAEADTALRSLLDEPTPAAPPPPDRFRYQLTITDGEATHHLAVNEQAVPAALRPLLRDAIAHGDIRPRDR